MTFSRSKLGPKLKGREWPPWKSSWATFFFSRQVFFFLGVLDQLYPRQNEMSTAAPLCALLRIKNKAKTKDINFVRKSFNPEARLPLFYSSFFIFFFILLLFIYFDWFFWISFWFFPFFDFFWFFDFWFFEFLFFSWLCVPKLKTKQLPRVSHCNPYLCSIRKWSNFFVLTVASMAYSTGLILSQ